MKEIYLVRIKYFFYYVLNLIISILPLNKQYKESTNAVYDQMLKDLKKKKNNLERNSTLIFTPSECANIIMKNSSSASNF